MVGESPTVKTPKQFAPIAQRAWPRDVREGKLDSIVKLVQMRQQELDDVEAFKEVLQAHMTDATCASCHLSIDPYDYAFENFDPADDWRDSYVQRIGDAAPTKEAKTKNQNRKKPQEAGTTVDSAAEFRNGESYNDVIKFRQLMKSDANQERFVRCFIEKLLLYANGEEPDDFAELDKILATSAKHDYRIIETVAAVEDSPFFRSQ